MLIQLQFRYFPTYFVGKVRSNFWKDESDFRAGTLASEEIAFKV